MSDFGSASYLMFAVVAVASVLCAPRAWRGALILAASTFALANTLSVWALMAYAGLLPVVYGLGLASQPKRRLRSFSFYAGVVLLLGGFVAVRLATPHLADVLSLPGLQILYEA